MLLFACIGFMAVVWASFGFFCDMIDLATILNGYRRTRVVVSYREHPLPDELYPESKWRRVLINMAKAMSHASGKSARNTEILLINNGEPKR